jgi:hypothetical protein
MKETKEVLHVICVVCQTIKSLKGEKFKPEDISKFIPLIEAVSVALKDADKIKAELKNINAEGIVLLAKEITEVKDSIVSLFDK